MAEPGKVVTEQQILDDIINSRGGPGAFTTIDLAVARALVGVLVQVGNGDASKASSIATLTEMLPPRTEAPPEKRPDLSVLSDKEFRTLELLMAKATGEKPPRKLKRPPESLRLRDAARLCAMADKIAVRIAASERPGFEKPTAAERAELRRLTSFVLMDGMGTLTFDQLLGIPIGPAHFASGRSDALPSDFKEPEIEPRTRSYP